MSHCCHETHKITSSSISLVPRPHPALCCLQFFCLCAGRAWERGYSSISQSSFWKKGVVPFSSSARVQNIYLVIFTPAWSQRRATVSQHETKALKPPSLLLPLVPLVVWIGASPMCSGQETTMCHPCPPGTTFSPYSNKTTTHPARCRPRLGSPLLPRRDTPTSSQGKTTSALLVHIYSHVAEPDFFSSPSSLLNSLYYIQYDDCCMVGQPIEHCL